MRTEYTIKITDPKGKTTTCTYPKRIAEQRAAQLRAKLNDCIVEYFKVVYYGTSFHHAEKIS